MVDTRCYKRDNHGGPIPSLEGMHQLINDSYRNRIDSVIKCARVTMTRGFKYFALSNRECLSAINALTTYRAMGFGSSGCPYEGKEKEMAVYKLYFGKCIKSTIFYQIYLWFVKHRMVIF